MHSTILPSSTGWNSKEPIFTHSRAPLMFAPTVGDQRQQEQGHAEGQQQVAVPVEVPRAAHHGQGDHVGRHPAGGPGRLQRGIALRLPEVDAEDHHVADPVQQERDGQDDRMGAGHEDPVGDVGDAPEHQDGHHQGHHVGGELAVLPRIIRVYAATMMTEAVTSRPEFGPTAGLERPVGPLGRRGPPGEHRHPGEPIGARTEFRWSRRRAARGLPWPEMGHQRDGTAVDGTAVTAQP